MRPPLDLFGPRFFVFICIYTYLFRFLVKLPGCQTQIVIGTQGKFIKWDGCLYRKVRISEEDASCFKCTIDTSMPTISISKSDWPQEYINCTDFCDYSTICTRALYYSTWEEPPVQKPLCYQCENKKDEVIWFESKHQHELCPHDCQRCAELVDLSDAVKCAPICKGYPTFCFPMRSLLGQRICYQASDWYGCDFLPISIPAATNGKYKEEDRKLTEKCKSCARTAKIPDNARYCAYACSWYPTYFNGTHFLQCRSHATLEDKNNQLFLFNVPDEIIEYIHMSNGSFLYSVDVGESNVLKYMDGIIAKQIYRKFDIARMNSPLSYNLRIRQDIPLNEFFLPMAP